MAKILNSAELFFWLMAPKKRNRMAIKFLIDLEFLVLNFDLKEFRILTNFYNCQIFFDACGYKMGRMVAETILMFLMFRLPGHGMPRRIPMG